MSVKLMCLNFNFCLYYSSVMDFKPRISSSVCGKLSIFKHPNEILSISYSEDLFKQTEHCTKLDQTLFSAIKLCMLYRPDYSCLQLWC